MALFLPQDQKLFREDGGWELVEAVARYWCSRMEWSEEEQLYHIRGTSAVGMGWKAELWSHLVSWKLPLPVAGVWNRMSFKATQTTLGFHDLKVPFRMPSG